jgi:hypothetical protein
VLPPWEQALSVDLAESVGSAAIVQLVPARRLPIEKELHRCVPCLQPGESGGAIRRTLVERFDDQTHALTFGQGQIVSMANSKIRGHFVRMPRFR